MFNELDEVAQRGYAIDNEEFMEGMVACAVPILDDQNRFIAALAFHGPAIRISLEDLHRKKSLLQEGAEKLSGIIMSDE